MLTGTLRTAYRRLVPRDVRERVSAGRQRARHFGARGDARFRRSLARLGALRDAHAGKPCVVIGNGPSMRGFDLSRIAGLHAFCLNRGYLMWNEQGLTPDFVVAVNPLVIGQFAAGLQAAGRLRFAPWLLRGNFDAADDDLVFFEERWDRAFLTDARDGVASLATVTNTALQLAWHMGFSTVVLLGIDHRFAAAGRGRPNELVVQDRDDVDHFRPDYFAPGTRWHLPDLAASEAGYALARRAFEGAGRRIVNATPGTGLDIFEKADLAAVLPSLRTEGR